MVGVPRHVKKEAVREFYDRKNRREKYARPRSMPEDEHRMERGRRLVSFSGPCMLHPMDRRRR